MQFKSTREVARDTRGRIHNELRALVPVSSTDTPELLKIHLIRSADSHLYRYRCPETNLLDNYYE